ncbi:MAG: hypothetical protein ACOX20_03605 [Limnochordia bacterium]
MAAIRILILIAKILGLIATGLNAIEATRQVSAASGVSFDTLWEHVPSRVK